MDELSMSPPDKKYWEAGGNCNMAIAAARLGLHCVAIGHVGDEIYGEFLLDVLHEEGIGTVALNGGTNEKDTSSFCETLICWVLVDPLQRHGFCRYCFLPRQNLIISMDGRAGLCGETVAKGI
jgi:hypothetical protein